jgi:zinc D-Ala-D-Ala carboxypeptidase
VLPYHTNGEFSTVLSMVESGGMHEPSRLLMRSLRVVGLLILTAFAVYGLISLFKSSPELRAEIAARDAHIAAQEAQLADYATQIALMQQALASSTEDASDLREQLDEERDRNDDFEDQIKDLSGTVGDLDKLSKIDAELLQKYSKVYFLNEHYEPPRVRAIDGDFIFKKSEPEYIHAQVEPFLEDLLEDAQEDGIELLVLSGFRSFDEQRGLKSAYTVQYGSGANAFSADQGYSEHQLGTAVDFTTPALNGSLTGFDATPAYDWLVKHAHRYGFILSYPPNNSYYVFEPWHWRFVGEDLADHLRDKDVSFYDLDQRDIDKYLISIFD